MCLRLSIEIRIIGYLVIHKKNAANCGNTLEKYYLSCVQLRLCSLFKSTFKEIKDRQRAFKVKGGFKDLKTHFNEYETQF
jgi:hypothetical protein